MHTLTDKQHEALIGSPRLSTYTAVTKDLSDALALYEINRRMSVALFIPQGDFEIILRNKTASALQTLYGRKDWFRCRALTSLLLERTRHKIKETRDRFKEKYGHPASPNDVTANITFGFWTALHNTRYRDSLWTPTLHLNWEVGTNLKAVNKGLNRINELRNRVAHYEPVFAEKWAKNHDLLTQHLELITGATNPNWTAQTKRLTQLRQEAMGLLQLP